MSGLMTSLELLEIGKKLLITNGWTQGAFSNEKDELCVIGALRQAATGDNYKEIFVDSGIPNRQRQAYREAFSILCAVAPKRDTVNNVIHFNDWPSTSFQDVIDLYDKAILEAKEWEARRN